MPRPAQQRYLRGVTLVALALVLNALGAHAFVRWVFGSAGGAQAEMASYASVALLRAEPVPEEAEDEMPERDRADVFVLAPVIEEAPLEDAEPRVVSDREQRVARESVARDAFEARQVSPTPSTPAALAPSRAGLRGDALAALQPADGSQERAQPDAPSVFSTGDLAEPDERAGVTGSGSGLPVPHMGDEGRDPRGELGGVDWEAFRPDLGAVSGVFSSPEPIAMDLVGVEESERTALNTRRVRYWSFLQRLTERVEQTWDPNRAWRAFDPARRELDAREYLTIIDFALSRHGAIEAVEVRRGCGVQALDREAIRALDAAAPFPNVPEALLDTDGYARIGFHFTFDARNTPPRVRWQRR